MKKVLFLFIFLNALNAAAQSDSVSNTITTDSTVVSDDSGTSASREMNLRVFPNPTSANATLKMHLMYAQYLKVDLMDLDGNLIKNITSQMFNSTEASVYMDLHGIRAGSYHVSVKGESGVEIAGTLLKIEH